MWFPYTANGLRYTNNGNVFLKSIILIASSLTSPFSHIVYFYVGFRVINIRFYIKGEEISGS